VTLPKVSFEIQNLYHLAKKRKKNCTEVIVDFINSFSWKFIICLLHYICASVAEKLLLWHRHIEGIQDTMLRGEHITTTTKRWYILLQTNCNIIFINFSMLETIVLHLWIILCNAYFFFHKPYSILTEE
jgi:hypothetical protein